MSDTFNWIDLIKETFGSAGEITIAAIRAEADPTAANVRAVVAAYAKNGIVPPADLLAHLKEINEARYPDDLAFPNPLPLLIAAGLLAWVILR